MKELSKEEVFGLFESRIKKDYKKSGSFLWRKPQYEETVLTIVAGKLETIKTANAGQDIILRNISIGSSAETYIIDKEKFQKRYDVVEGVLCIEGTMWEYCEAKGMVDAFCYHGETIKFVAPWNEEMLCEDGDYIARPVGGKPDDIYRIEKETFHQTYKEIV